MFGSFPQPQYMPCPECGATLENAEMDQHVCEQERWLNYQLFQLREEIAGFDRDVGTYLASAKGQFELWYAERQRAARGKGSAS